MFYSRNRKRVIAAALALTLIMSSIVMLSGCEKNDSEASSNNPVVISEVMSSNSAFAPAADGKYYDWVELYNSSKQEIDLSDCYISDTEDMPLQYRLEGLVIEGGAYAIVYLSDGGFVDGAGTHHADFMLSAHGELLMLSDKQGSVIAQLQVPELRENVSYGLIPDGSGEYAMFATPTPGFLNSGTYSTNIDELSYADCPVIINEYMSDNSFTHCDSDGDYGDWVELYNPSDSAYDLFGASLTDDENSPGKWCFPQGAAIGSGEYIVVWCDGKDKLDSLGEYHTSFSLGGNDAVIAFYTNQRQQASVIELSAPPENISCGRPSNSAEIKLFSRPTPGKANSGSGYEQGSIVSPDIGDGLMISEVLSVSSASGLYRDDYIELFNSASTAVNLGAYTISQAPGEAVFTFPDISLASGEYLVVWCDGKLKNTDKDNLHCPIKLSQCGESLYLADSSGKICDYFETGKTSYGVSSGRIGSDCATRVLFTVPTPKEQNSVFYADGYSPMPEISLGGGYISAGTTVEITAPEGCAIYYTTDGSDPELYSSLYSAPITINSTTVLKAAAYKSGRLLSQVVCESYFIEEGHDIPIVSLSGDYEEIFGVGGFYTNFANDELSAGVRVEYYETSGNKAVEFNAEASVFGEYSRKQKQKGIKLELKEKYGENEVTYPFFKESVSGVSTFSDLLLRPSGQDQSRAKLRDEITAAIVRGAVDIDYQEFQAVALYVNGEYYGLYYLRERLNADYLERKHGFEEGSYNLVKAQGYARPGYSVTEYLELEKYATYHDLTDAECYDYMCSQIDIDSFINFWIIETYLGNSDSGNVRCYKEKNGEWCWMIYDFDWAFTINALRTNYIQLYCLGSGHGAEQHCSNILIKRLLANDEFRDRFISLYCYHINTTFAPDRVLPLVDENAAVIESEMPRQFKRWGFPTMYNWEYHVSFIKEYLSEKPEIAKKQLKDAFWLSDAEINRYMRENTEYTPYEYS